MSHVLYHKPLFNKLIIKNIIFLNDILFTINQFMMGKERKLNDLC